jgi:hypothetical protein
MVRKLFGKRRGPKSAGHLSYRPMVEALEDRWVPSVVSHQAPAPAVSALTAAASNGSATQMSAFYEGNLFTINFTQLGSTAAQSLIAHNKSINLIFTSTATINGQPFTMVINANRGPGEGPGFNPLWREVQITFLTIPPQQFTSADAIMTAASMGQISLTFTNNVFRCAVVGGPG